MAVKVLAEIQKLSSPDKLRPQDPVTQGPWAETGQKARPASHPSKGSRQGSRRVAGLKVIEDDSSSHGWGSDDDDDSSIGDDSEADSQPDEHAEALQTLEREVGHLTQTLQLCLAAVVHCPLRPANANLQIRPASHRHEDFLVWCSPKSMCVQLHAGLRAILLLLVMLQTNQQRKLSGQQVSIT